MAFIKIDKEILNSYCFSNPNHLKIWIWMLVKANYKKCFIPVNSGRGTTTIEVDRGQFIFGRFKAEEELNLNGSLIYRTLQKFEELGQINLHSNNQYTVITICKYDDYQNKNDRNEQQTNNERTMNEQSLNNERTMNEQSLNTSKEILEDKEYKENKEEYIGKNANFNSNLNRKPNIPTKEEVWEVFQRSGGTKEMAKSFFEKYESVGWVTNTGAVTNFIPLANRFISTWNTIEEKSKQKNNPQQQPVKIKLKSITSPNHD
jgi:hypothetical protein